MAITLVELRLRLYQTWTDSNETTDEFQPTEEEIKVFENIKNGKEKVTQQNAEDLIKELNDAGDGI